MKTAIKLYIISNFFSFSYISSYAQATEILWQHSYGGADIEGAQAIEITPDSGFVVAGYTNSIDGDITTALGFDDYWLLKLDSLGGLEWQKSYGGSSIDACYDVILTADSGFILVGYSSSDDGDVLGQHGNWDFWVVKTDNLGGIEWQKALGGTDADWAKTIIQTTDGGYLIAGGSDSNDGDVTGHHGDANSDVWIVKLNTMGEIMWQKSFGSLENDLAEDAIQTSDGNYMVVGYTSDGSGDVSDFSGERDFWVLKISADGILIWNKTFGGNDIDEANSVIETPDSTFLIAGITSSDEGDVTGFHGGFYDGWIIKIDSVGNLVWQKCYGGTDVDEITSITSGNSGNYVFGGCSISSDFDLTENKGGCDYWIGMIDSMGNLLSQKTAGGSTTDQAWDIVQTGDSNYVLAGYTLSSDFDVTESIGLFDYWIVEFGICDDRYFVDLDGDGYGNVLFDSVSCNVPFGYVTDSTDCNDTAITIHPLTKDICNNIDDNCNGEIDENAAFYLWFADTDNDEYGNSDIDSLACLSVEGYVLDSTDCDDTNQDIYPGAPEILNGLDDDCDGMTDEGLSIEDNILNTISIYPNPTANILHIELIPSLKVEIEISNVTGQIIYSKGELSTNKIIDVREFSSGVYLLKIYSNEYQATLSFVRE